VAKAAVLLAATSVSRLYFHGVKVFGVMTCVPLAERAWKVSLLALGTTDTSSKEALIYSIENAPAFAGVVNCVDAISATLMQGQLR
jgi:hypothetical protein